MDGPLPAELKFGENAVYIITDKDYVTSQSKRQIVMVHTSCKDLYDVLNHSRVIN